MKNILFLFIIVLCRNLYAEPTYDYELDFIQYETDIVKKNNLISKQQVIDIMYKTLVNHYRKVNASELKEMLYNADVILVEDITPEEARIVEFVQFYYVIQVKLNDGRILAIDTINAQNGKLKDGIMMDINDKNDFVVLLDRSEIIEYTKKNVNFPEDSKLTIRAIYDYSFYYDICMPNRAIYWKYSITVENGTFNFTSPPTGSNTLFVSPYVESYQGKKEEARPNNGFTSALIKNRLYTYQFDNKSKTTSNEAINKTLESKKTKNKYIGID